MRRIAVINQKGGCGKTTTAINLAGIFAQRGLRTLLVDMDPQSHCAAGLAIPEQRIDLDVGDAMLAARPESLDPARLLWRVCRNLDLIPSRTRLAGLEAARGGLSDAADKEHRLGRFLATLQGTYDVCCIDCSPSIGLLTFNALTAATEVLVPVETSYFSLQGAAKQVSAIRSLNRRLGVNCPFWLLGTIHDESSALAKDLLGELRQRFEPNVAPAVIRYDTALKEAASFGQPVIEYAPNSKGAQDYTALAHWLLERSPARPPTPDLPEPKPAGPVLGRAHELVRRVADAPSRSGGHAEPAAPDVVVRPAEAQAPVSASGGELLLAARRLVQARAQPEAPARPREPERFGVRQTAEGVLFTQPASAGRNMGIAGDFNNWCPEPMRLNEGLGRFELCLPLSPGRRQYRLVIDGRWATDPYNPETQATPFGAVNSVAQVSPAPARP